MFYKDPDNPENVEIRQGQTLQQQQQQQEETVIDQATFFRRMQELLSESLATSMAAVDEDHDGDSNSSHDAANQATSGRQEPVEDNQNVNRDDKYANDRRGPDRNKRKNDDGNDNDGDEDDDDENLDDNSKKLKKKKSKKKCLLCGKRVKKSSPTEDQENQESLNAAKKPTTKSYFKSFPSRFNSLSSVHQDEFIRAHSFKLDPREAERVRFCARCYRQLGYSLKQFKSNDSSINKSEMPANDDDSCDYDNYDQPPVPSKSLDSVSSISSSSSHGSSSTGSSSSYESDESDMNNKNRLNKNKKLTVIDQNNNVITIEPQDSEATSTRSNEINSDEARKQQMQKLIADAISKAAFDKSKEVARVGDESSLQEATSSDKSSSGGNVSSSSSSTSTSALSELQKKGLPAALVNSFSAEQLEEVMTSQVARKYTLGNWVEQIIAKMNTSGDDAVSSTNGEVDMMQSGTGADKLSAMMDAKSQLAQQPIQSNSPSTTSLTVNSAQSSMSHSESQMVIFIFSILNKSKCFILQLTDYIKQKTPLILSHIMRQSENESKQATEDGYPEESGTRADGTQQEQDDVKSDDSGESGANKELLIRRISNNIMSGTESILTKKKRLTEMFRNAQENLSGGSDSNNPSGEDPDLVVIGNTIDNANNIMNRKNSLTRQMLLDTDENQRAYAKNPGGVESDYSSFYAQTGKRDISSMYNNASSSNNNMMTGRKDSLAMRMLNENESDQPTHGRAMTHSPNGNNSSSIVKPRPLHNSADIMSLVMQSLNQDLPPPIQVPAQPDSSSSQQSNPKKQRLIAGSNEPITTTSPPGQQPANNQTKDLILQARKYAHSGSPSSMQPLAPPPTVKTPGKQISPPQPRLSNNNMDPQALLNLLTSAAAMQQQQQQYKNIPPSSGYRQGPMPTHTTPSPPNQQRSLQQGSPSSSMRGPSLGRNGPPSYSPSSNQQQPITIMSPSPPPHHHLQHHQAQSHHLSHPMHSQHYAPNLPPSHGAHPGLSSHHYPNMTPPSPQPSPRLTMQQQQANNMNSSNPGGLTPAQMAAIIEAATVAASQATDSSSAALVAAAAAAACIQSSPLFSNMNKSGNSGNNNAKSEPNGLDANLIQQIYSAAASVSGAIGGNNQRHTSPPNPHLPHHYAGNSNSHTSGHHMDMPPPQSHSANNNKARLGPQHSQMNDMIMSHNHHLAASNARYIYKVTSNCVFLLTRFRFRYNDHHHQSLAHHHSLHQNAYNANNSRYPYEQGRQQGAGSLVPPRSGNNSNNNKMSSSASSSSIAAPVPIHYGQQKYPQSTATSPPNSHGAFQPNPSSLPPSSSPLYSGQQHPSQHSSYPPSSSANPSNFKKRLLNSSMPSSSSSSSQAGPPSAISPPQKLQGGYQGNSQRGPNVAAGSLYNLASSSSSSSPMAPSAMPQNRSNVMPGNANLSNSLSKLITAAIGSNSSAAGPYTNHHHHHSHPHHYECLSDGES